MATNEVNELHGLRMVVTGAGRGIGREIAQRAALAGAQVALLEIDETNLDNSVKVIKALGGNVSGYLVDLGVEKEVKSILANVEEDFGGIDCLINNAMIYETEDLLQTSLEVWERSIRITLTASFLCIRAVLPGMISQGSGNVINIGTVNAKSMLGGDAYSVAKAGLHALTRSVAVRYGPDGIRCNTVVPGSIDSETWQARREANPELFESLVGWYPLGRIGKAKDIAEAVLFLASAKSAWMSGSEMIVDGGLLAGHAPMLHVLERPVGRDE
jgi:meso-butanediol dehydrogenase/(S,S)-butanediol dehydrogenase/diacetyl reductase